MKTRNLFLVVGLVWLISGTVAAQSFEENALLFGQSQPTGSARILGMSGVGVALGGDYTASFANPAGLGMYNRNEFTLSPAISSFNSTSDYFGTRSEDSKSVFNIPGISLVYNMPMEEGGFLGGSFGMSVTRTASFHFAGTYEGENSASSIIDYFIERANGNFPDDLDYNSPTGLAYDTYLMGPISEVDPGFPNGDITYYTNELSVPYQREEINIKGAINQINLAYGGNYNDRLFFGAAVGISSLKYKALKTYSEIFTNDTLNYLILNEDFDIRGSGINATIGLIGRPVDFIQVGLSFTTPTYYTLTDTYYASLEADWNNFDYFGDGSTILGNRFSETDPDGLISEYTITIPLKFKAGVTLISKNGFITGEAEFFNPRKTKYGSEVSGISFSPENELIRSLYQPVSTYRVGGEYRYRFLRARAGYSYTSNAVRAQFANSQRVTSISGGLGMRFKTFFTDFAVSRSTSNNNYKPYTFDDGYAPVASFSNKFMNYVLTVGVNF